MNLLILRTTARFLITLMLLFSMFLLFRGHNAPGGGFTGGLVAAAAWTLYTVANGTISTRYALRFDPRVLIGVGIITAVFSGIVAMLVGKPMLTGQWFSVEFGPIGPTKLGTPLLFDLGVYLVVVGVILTIIFAVEETQ